MNHQFLPSQTNKNICQICKYDYLSAHSPLAKCEACDSNKELEFFPDNTHIKKMLLCAACIQKELAIAVSVSQADIVINGQTRVEQTIALAKERDQTIRYNGDFFNAQVMALEDVRNEINKDESLTADEKAFQFQNYLAERIVHLKKVVFELDEKKHQAVTEELVVRKSLRELGQEIKKEIQEKIKQADSNYEIKSTIKAVKPTVKKATTSTYDKLVQAFMLLKGCSKDEAERSIREGSGGKLGNEKLTTNTDKIPF